MPFPGRGGDCSGDADRHDRERQPRGVRGELPGRQVGRGLCRVFSDDLLDDRVTSVERVSPDRGQRRVRDERVAAVGGAQLAFTRSPFAQPLSVVHLHAAWYFATASAELPSARPIPRSMSSLYPSRSNSAATGSLDS